MTVFEAHLQVNQRLQEVASYKRDKLRPEELDLALNKAMHRLLEMAINSDFEGTEIKLSHVAGLIKKNKPLNVVIPGIADPLYENPLLSVYSVLPPDLNYLINARTEIVTDTTNCSTAPNVTTTTLPEYMAVVPFPVANVSAPYFPAVAVTSSVAGSLYTAPAAISAGFQNTRSQYVITNNILETLASHATLRVYWERYRDTYYKNSFIFVSESNFGTITISGTGLTSSAVAMTQTSYTTYNRASIAGISTALTKIQQAKVMQEDQLYSAIGQNNFYKSRPSEVLVDQLNDFLVFYREESFLITRGYIDYIRKPRTISLLLGQDCELAASSHHKIVDLAVEILRLDTKDQAYPQTVQDTQIRTI